jgi:hypothetical protein
MTESKDASIILFMVFLMILVAPLTFVGWVIVGPVCLFLTAFLILLYVNINFLLKPSSPASSLNVVDQLVAFRLKISLFPISFTDNARFENTVKGLSFFYSSIFFSFLSLFIAFCSFLFAYFLFQDLGLSKFYLDGVTIFFSLFSIVIDVVFIKALKIIVSYLK